jgi:hypothetical protein
MGGCADGRPYPPPRRTPPDRPRDDLDPSLAFDVADYGHLGYDGAAGPPSAAGPVQGQYRGTWDLWQPPNADPGVAAFLADKVVESLRASATRPAAAGAIALHRLDAAAQSPANAVPGAVAPLSRPDAASGSDRGNR